MQKKCKKTCGVCTTENTTETDTTETTTEADTSETTTGADSSTDTTGITFLIFVHSQCEWKYLVYCQYFINFFY